MAKSAGGTRGSSWRDKATPQTEKDIVLITNLAKSGELGNGDYDMYRKESAAWDNLSNSQKLEALEMGSFTGMFVDDDLELLNTVYARPKESFIQELNESILYNLKDGYNMEDENHFVIKFRRQAKPIHTEDYDFLYKTNNKGVEVHRSKLTKKEINNIEWIASNYSTSLTGYYAKDAAAHADMVKYMGFHEYKNGKEIASWNGKTLKEIYK